MSRIGKLPVAIIEGVEVTADAACVTVKGPKGSLDLNLPDGISVKVDDNKILVDRASDAKPHRACHGLVRSLLFNMVEGVTKGYEKRLDIVGVGYRAEVRGSVLVVQVGFCHPVEKDIPNGLDVSMEGQTRISVKGIDKQQVGQFAAEVRKISPPEPYKGKGIKYENEQVRRKAAKAFAGGAM